MRKGSKMSLESVEKIRQSRLGKKLSPEHRLKIKLACIGINSGEKNGIWVGDDITYKSLHQYLHKHLLKTNKCQICKKVPPYDLANVTGNYNRDFKNWKWLCRRCHMLSDGRMNNLRQYRK